MLIAGHGPSVRGAPAGRSTQIAGRAGGRRIDHRWLDHDLVAQDTIRPIVELGVGLARRRTLGILQIRVHSTNDLAGRWMGVELRAAGYPWFTATRSPGGLAVLTTWAFGEVDKGQRALTGRDFATW
jgi:hypothetical protein